MNCMQIDKASISNGLGVRVVLWCAGCTRNCQGCFNPETWDFDAGKHFDTDAKEYLFEQLSKPYIKGITFSGGHPLEIQNVEDVYNLIAEIKERFPDKDIWLYTGYILNVENFVYRMMGEDVRAIHHNYINKILNMCDVVVDGPYMQELRNLTLAFRGSENQRIIDVKKTIENGEITLVESLY